MDWPPYSPNLNPIEKVSALLKKRIIERYTGFDNMPNTEELFNLLEMAAVECWEDVNQDFLYRLVTMPRRVQTIHHSRGWYTKCQ